MILLLATTAVESFTRMQKRRLAFRLLVPYRTTPAQLREAVARIRDLLREHPGIHPDVVFVFVNDFTDTAFEITVACYTRTVVLAEFLALREEVSLVCLEVLAAIGVEPTVPGRALLLLPDDAETRARLDAEAQALLAARSARAASPPSTDPAIPSDLPAR
jgi:MscS family membrane protein